MLKFFEKFSRLHNFFLFEIKNVCTNLNVPDSFHLIRIFSQIPPHIRKPIFSFVVNTKISDKKNSQNALLIWFLRQEDLTLYL